jgi:RNA polymerase sigma-70 factor (ECF subfamily)
MRGRNRSSPDPVDEEPAEDLLARFRDGDQAAFDAIVVAYQARLIHFFYRLCWDRDRAEDFAQMLFMKLLRGAGNYRPEGKLSTFLFRVATNLWIDHYRASRPRGRIYSLDQALLDGVGLAEAAPGPRPDETAERNEEKERLRTALEQLTEPHRLVFELAVYQEMPYAQIGEVLGIPVGTVKSRMHNSVRALREILEREMRDEAGFRDTGAAALTPAACTPAACTPAARSMHGGGRR